MKKMMTPYNAPTNKGILSRPPVAKPLRIDFDLYCEGDEAYKNDLCRLLIENVRELHQGLSSSVTTANRHIFLAASHKAKVTISILADEEFTAVVEKLELQASWDADDTNLSALRREFEFLSDAIIGGLQAEARVAGEPEKDAATHSKRNSPPKS